MPDDNNGTFSQRSGLVPLPSQLELGKLSKELRALIWATIDTSMRETQIRRTTGYNFLGNDWQHILRGHFVEIMHEKSHEFRSYINEHQQQVSEFIFSASYNSVFDFLEYVLQHPRCPGDLAGKIAQCFEKGRAAYRLIDHTIILPIGNEVEAETIETSISNATKAGVSGAKSHLVSAIEEARRGDWAGSVRESISAVESVAIVLAPDTRTLGAALGELEKRGHLHGALKSAFSKLYGFTSDENGVRHALVLQDKAKVDEADALFMLGACASFVSYLVAKGRQIGVIKT